MSRYAVRGGHPAGPHDAWPSREPAAAAAHAQAYEEQRLRLVAELERTGQQDALFVATVFAMSREDGGAHTWATWTEGVLTLLPAADVVLLVEQPPSAGSEPATTWVRWDVVAQLCADECWELVPGLDPVRVLTQAWPTAARLSELRARQLPGPAG